MGLLDGGRVAELTGTFEAGARMSDLDSRIDELLDRFPTVSTPRHDFLGAQFDAGLAYVQFPVGYGGLGIDRSFQNEVDRRLREAGAPNAFDINPIGFGMGGPTVQTYGTEEQKQRYLRPLFSCEDIWCQLFSEPGAGSDLASVSTTAVRDGDTWVVTGQKVWTSLAHRARFGLLLARTDPAASKHAGLTYFVLDMHAPGVEVRPLRQLTGEAEFNEVFLDDVPVSDGQRLGGVGEGWTVAMTTLSYERLNTGDERPRGGGPISVAIQAWAEREDKTSAQAQALRDRLMRAWVEAEIFRLTGMRAAESRGRGAPGPEGSVGKLHFAAVTQMAFDVAVDLTGSAGLIHPEGYAMVRPEKMGFEAESSVTRSFLRAQANSIEGGTSNIMRKILAERVLGLPPDPRPDAAWPVPTAPAPAR
jgi:alkylation response protein AidB-like acyl-CoA dehydrogenase